MMPEKNGKKKRRLWSAYYSITRLANDQGRLVSAAGRPDEPMPIQTHHGTGFYQMVSKQLLIGGSGSGGDTLESMGANDLRLTGGDGFLIIGFLPRPKSLLRIYPFVGIGGGGLDIKSESAFPEAEHPSVLFSAGALMVTVGIGIEVKLGSSYGFIVGFRMGYTFHWLPVEGEKVHLGPTTFMTLLFGGGIFDRK